MQFTNLQTKRDFVSGKVIIGIDPSKEKYDAAVLDKIGLLQGKTFSFKNNHLGLEKQLWNCLNIRIADLSEIALQSRRGLSGCQPGSVWQIPKNRVPVDLVDSLVP